MNFAGKGLNAAEITIRTDPAPPKSIKVDTVKSDRTALTILIEEPYSRKPCYKVTIHDEITRPLHSFNMTSIAMSISGLANSQRYRMGVQYVNEEGRKSQEVFSELVSTYYDFDADAVEFSLQYNCLVKQAKV